MELGKKIRQLRTCKGISIAQLAKMTGLSTGIISQIERDMVSPTVDTLWKITKALDISINYFFNDGKHLSPIVRKNERKKIILPNSRVTYMLLSPDVRRKMEFLLVEIEPGECNSTELISHEGEECGFILSGTLKIKYGEEEYILYEGDSIYFDSTVPHRYINIGDKKCISIWAMTPPSF